MRLRHETRREEQKHNSFRSALKLTAVSAALLLPMVSTTPIFANTASAHNIYSEFTQEQIKRRDHMWEAKIKFVAAEFKKQHPNSRLVEQDYGVIKTINASLPEEKRLNAFEWLAYQNAYLNADMCERYNLPLAASIAKSEARHRASTAINDAICRTKANYPNDVSAGANAPFYAQKTTRVVVKTVPRSSSAGTTAPDAYFQNLARNYALQHSSAYRAHQPKPLPSKPATAPAERGAQRAKKAQNNEISDMLNHFPESLPDLANLVIKAWLVLCVAAVGLSLLFGRSKPPPSPSSTNEERNPKPQTWDIVRAQKSQERAAAQSRERGWD